MTYSGLFLRHYQGDQPGATWSGQNLSDSPDILLEGKSPVDPATLVTLQNYQQEPPNVLWVGSQQSNYLYVRALNATNGPIKGRLWLWYAEPNILVWPQNWISNTIWVDGKQQNWSDVSATSPNQIVVGEAFVVVSPPTPQDHYCTIAIAENPPVQDPPSPPFPGYFPTLNDFAAWIQKTPYAAWRNTIDQSTTAATWNWNSAIAGPDEGGQLTVGVQCQGMPVGSQYQFTVPGGTTKKGDTWGPIDSGMRTVQNPNENISVLVTWPGGVNTGMNVTWYANNTTPSVGATMTPNIGVMGSSLEGLLEEPYRGATQTILYDDFADASSARISYRHILGGVPLRAVPPSQLAAARTEG